MQNVWKCFVFWAFALKVWKNANMTQTIFFQLKFIWGIKKRRILCWLQIRWNGLEKTFRKKGIGKKRSEKVQNPKNSKFASFYAYNFFLESFFRAHFNESVISIKFCVFWCPIWIFFLTKFLWVILAFFSNFECKCSKNETFSNILQKVKSYCFANSYHSLFESNRNFKKSIKLKPPIHHVLVLHSWDSNSGHQDCKLTL